MMHKGMFSILMAAALLTGAAWAGPVGPEFQVNTYTTSYQFLPSVGMNGSGNFVVAWGSHEQDGDLHGGVYGQRYDVSGTAQGGEFHVNTYTTGTQRNPSVAMDGSGNFVVVWQSEDQDGDNWGVYGQRYDTSGVAQGSEFQVNTYTMGEQRDPSVAMDGSGNFVVVWGHVNGSGICGQRYDASGTAQGAEFQVTTMGDLTPSVAMNEVGNFVVVWHGYGQDGDGVYGQRYDASGTAQGSEFQVNTYTTSEQWYPSVAMNEAGNFVVVWESWLQDGSGDGVYGQRYDAFGNAQGAEFQVNTYTMYSQMYPSVDMDGLGNFVVVWESDGQDGSYNGVYGQRYDASGTAQGGEFQVNTYTMDDQSYPSVGMDSSGNFVVAWTSNNQDGSLWGVYAQRYAPTPTVDIIVATASNLTEGGTLGFYVTFSEAVTGVDVSDFALFITGDLVGAVILSVTGSGSEYTVLVGNVAGVGTLRLDLIDDDSIINGGGNPLGGTGTGNGDFTAGGVYNVVLQLPIAMWPVMLVLLVLGAVGSFFYTTKRTVKKGE